MPIQYPAPPPTVSGDYTTISRFLNSPTLLARRVRDIASERFISDVLLTGRYTVSGGSLQYNLGDTSIYTDRPVEQVAPGGEYPLAGLGVGPAQVVSVAKWGQDALVTDEAVHRLSIDPVNRALTKMVNQMVKTVDSLALGAISSAITNTFAVNAPWTGGSATILRDILLAVSQVRNLNLGFEPNVLVVNDTIWAYIASDPTIAEQRRREDPNNPIYTGTFPQIAGVTIFPTPNSPTPGVPLLLDTTQLGGMADENLGGPGYVGSVAGVDVKTMREDENDRWRLRCRRVTAPVVLEPSAGVRLTGVTA